LDFIELSPGQFDYNIKNNPPGFCLANRLKIWYNILIIPMPFPTRHFPLIPPPFRGKIRAQDSPGTQRADLPPVFRPLGAVISENQKISGKSSKGGTP
jgi:hypothetical protein